MFGQSLLSAFGSAACTTDTDQLFTSTAQAATTATYELNNATTSIPSNTYPGTANNITYAAGKFGNAAVFNGSSSSIQMPNDSFNYTTMSFSAWVNPSANDAFNYIFQNGMYDNRIGGSIGWYVRREQGGALLARGFSSNSLSGYEFEVTSASGLIPLNTWTNVVCVLTPTSFNIYVNGNSTAVASATFTNSITYSASQPVAIHVGISYYYYNGAIYEYSWEGAIDHYNNNKKSQHV
jgi:arabinan endo-1,5-alpha-L-arabinosidase